MIRNVVVKKEAAEEVNVSHKASIVSSAESRDSGAQNCHRVSWWDAGQATLNRYDLSSSWTAYVISVL